MKKLLIFMIVAITANFFGGNLINEVKAETTPGVTYVTEGNLVYVHFGTATDTVTHLTDINLFSTQFPNAISEETGIRFDIPKNAIKMYLLEPAGIYSEIGSGPDQLPPESQMLIYNYEGNLNITDISLIIDDFANGVYFEIDLPIYYETVGSKDYVMFKPEMIESNRTINLTDSNLLNHYVSEENYLARIEKQTTGTVLKLLNFETATTTVLGDASTQIYDIRRIDGQGHDGMTVYFDEDYTAGSGIDIVDGMYELYFEESNTLNTSRTINFNFNTATDSATSNLNSTMYQFIKNNRANITSVSSIRNELDEISEYVSTTYNPVQELVTMNFSYSDGTFTMTLLPDGTVRFKSDGRPDSGAQSVVIDFDLIAVDTIEPVLSPSSISLNFNNPLAEFLIREQMTAIDDVDGDISEKIEYVGGTYETARINGTLEIGVEYTVLYSVKDTSLNETTATIIVQLFDITGPFFGIDNVVVEIPYTEDFDAVAFIPSLLVYDATDPNPVITVESNNFVLGDDLLSQTVTYKALDKYGNYSTITITIKKIDNESPVFNGQTEYDIPFLSHTSIGVLLQNINATDAIDGLIHPQLLSDNYTAATTTGIYEVSLKYTDLSGNSTYIDLTIRLTDGMPPILYITKNLTIATNELNALTLQQIISLISQVEGILLTDVNLTLNSYEGNESTFGTYEVLLNAKDPSGTVRNYSTSIVVTSGEVNNFTVTFETNGGTLIESMIVANFGQVIVTSPVKAGYTFIGWYKDVENTQAFSIVNDRITSDTTLYAKWSSTSGGGGSVIVDNLGNLTTKDYIIFGLAALGLIAIGIQFSKKRG